MIYTPNIATPQEDLALIPAKLNIGAACFMKRRHSELNPLKA